MKNSTKKFISGILFLTLIVIIAGCTTKLPKQQPVQQPSTDTPAQQGAATQKLIKFQTIEEVRKFLSQQSQVQPSFGISKGMGVAEMAVADAAPQASQASRGAGGTDDYSQTNVQVAGVDEADFVKNDGKYVYIIADNKLLIVDAFDAENAEIISTTTISKEQDGSYENPRARELFVNADQLLLFVEANERSFYFEKYDIQPRPTYKQVTYALLYDISDREQPELVEEFSFPGSYYQSRMIEDKVYLVSQEGTQNIFYEEPLVKWGSQIMRPEIYYFDNPDQNYQFNTVSSIDLSEKKVIDTKTFMLGYANTLMVSENNIYIAYQKQDYWRWGWRSQQYEKERFDEIILPRLPTDLKNDIKNIDDQRISDEEKWAKISDRLSQFYKDVENDEDLQSQYEDLFGDIQDALEEYDTKKSLEDRKTIIHKISIKDGNINHEAEGEVYGSLLNQFSLDEYQGNLRVATTVDLWSGNRVTYNNVYVLDSDLQQIGKVENIAKDERIYSTRFLGDRLYMVTFQQTDPLFVIDLSSPTNPKILGELKIPGFSNYLHPYDQNHIIGVGKETKETDSGGVTIEGIKIALFDVSDISKPKVVDKVVIGDSGSDSAVLYDHKAFLFSKEKNLLVIPVTELTERQKIQPYMYSYSVWHGAYVFHLDASGFDEIGKVKHSSSRSDYWNWWDATTVLRSLYMDNNLYTISNKYIKINDLSNDLEELNSIKLPTTNEYYYWR